MPPPSTPSRQKYTPQSRGQLKRFILKEISKHGDECSLNHIDVSNITDFSDIFKGTKFNGNLSQWDVSNGRDFSGMFEGTPFNGNISYWDVSKGLDFKNMFQRSAFTGDISKWNMSCAEDCTSMFADSAFNNDISCWDVSNITSMHNMFLNSPFAGDVSRWNVANVRNVTGMFFVAAFDGNLSDWHLNSDCMNTASLLDFVSHHEPGMRKNLRLPILPVEVYRLFRSKETMHVWLAERAGQGHVDRYHWDALLREPDTSWAPPKMTQMVQTYLSFFSDVPEPCIEHSALLMQSWTQMPQLGSAWSLPDMEESTP